MTGQQTRPKSSWELRAVKAEEQCRELLVALKTAACTIETWHGMGMGAAEQQAWSLYQASSEMRQINAAIAKAEGG